MNNESRMYRHLFSPPPLLFLHVYGTPPPPLFTHVYGTPPPPLFIHVHG